MNISTITHPEAKRFLESFLGNREINKEYYKRVPEDKYDFRMVDTPERKVKAPWSSNPIPAIASLWGLDYHEVLHMGWNLAVMDHLNIHRFPALKEMWGG